MATSTSRENYICQKETGDYVLCVIRNIPSILRSSDLRNYFSQYIENDGFKCFHFRHRPELQTFNKVVGQVNTNTNSEKQSENPTDSEIHIDGSTLNDCKGSVTATEANHSSYLSKHSNRETTCCVVKLKSSKFVEFSHMYHRKHWLDRKGDIMTQLCIIERVKAPSSISCVNGMPQPKYETKFDSKSSTRVDFSHSDLLALPELNPPRGMPRGNVGTPTRVFMSQIKQCRLPASVVKKLGLRFPRHRPRKQFSTVPFKYCVQTRNTTRERKTRINKIENCNKALVDDLVKDAHLSGSEETSDDIIDGDNDDIIDGDSDDIIDGDVVNDVHLNDDAVVDAEGRPILDEDDYSVLQNQQKSREPKDDKELTKLLKEERIEEKIMHHNLSDSGEDEDGCEEWERHEALCDDPGTQDRNKERLFEEEIELKWEKGGSGLVFYTDAQYWQEKEGDFDEQTTDDWDVDMSVYYEKSAGDKDSRDLLTIRKERKRRLSTEAKIGAFEKHTKGIGRKIMQQQGWMDGGSLGHTVHGITEALGNDGQSGSNKSGFGYRGEKLAQHPFMKRPTNRTAAPLISTCYDRPHPLDDIDSVYRGNEPTALKHRRTR